MATIRSEEEFRQRFQVNDLLWRVSFEGYRPREVEGPLTIVEIRGIGEEAVVSLRNNDGEQLTLQISDLICEHCAVFEFGSEAWGWFQDRQSGRA